MTQVQVLLGLCLASFSVAAPQVGSRRTVTTTSQGVSSNPDQIVTSVLSSLQQPIAIAVAEALKGLKTTRTVSTTGSTSGFGNSGFSSSSLSSSKSGSSSANTGLNSFANFKSSSGFGKSGLNGATSGLGVAHGVSTKRVVASQSSKPVELGPYLKPAYNFEYKVSDDSAQTYISREEARDGTELTGSYNFVDPTGALVTVNYNAGVGGYEETRQVQDGAVQINAQPVSTYESSFESSAAADLAASQYAAAQRATAQRLATEQAAAQRVAVEQAAAKRAAQQKSAAAFRAQQAALKIASEKRIATEKAAAQRLSATTSSTSNSNALIANIIAALQPQIGTAVQSAIGSSRSVSSRTPVVQTSSIRAVSAPVPSVRTVSVRTEAVPSSSSYDFSSSSSQASGLSSLFGNGGNVVRIATPKFQVEY